MPTYHFSSLSTRYFLSITNPHPSNPDLTRQFLSSLFLFITHPSNADLPRHSSSLSTPYWLSITNPHPSNADLPRQFLSSLFLFITHPSNADLPRHFFSSLSLSAFSLSLILTLVMPTYHATSFLLSLSLLSLYHSSSP